MAHKRSKLPFCRGDSVSVPFYSSVLFLWHCFPWAWVCSSASTHQWQLLSKPSAGTALSSALGVSLVWHGARAGYQWHWGWHLWENSKRMWERWGKAGFRVLGWLMKEARIWGSNCNQFQGNQIYYVANFFLPTKKKKYSSDALGNVLMFHPWFWCISHLLLTSLLWWAQFWLGRFLLISVLLQWFQFHIHKNPGIQVCWCREEQGTKIPTFHCFWWKDFWITLELEIVFLN